MGARTVKMMAAKRMEWMTDARHVDAVHLHFLEMENPAVEREKKKGVRKGGSMRSQVKLETGCSEKSGFGLVRSGHEKERTLSLNFNDIRYF